MKLQINLLKIFKWIAIIVEILCIGTIITISKETTWLIVVLIIVLLLANTLENRINFENKKL